MMICHGSNICLSSVKCLFFCGEATVLGWWISSFSVVRQLLFYDRSIIFLWRGHYSPFVEVIISFVEVIAPFQIVAFFASADCLLWSVRFFLWERSAIPFQQGVFSPLTKHSFLFYEAILSLYRSCRFLYKCLCYQSYFSMYSSYTGSSLIPLLTNNLRMYSCSEGSSIRSLRRQR